MRCVHIFSYFLFLLLLLLLLFCNLPDSRNVTICTVAMTNESARQNGGFYFVVILTMATLLCRNRVPTVASYDSCDAQDCSNIKAMCKASRVLFGVTGVYLSINRCEYYNTCCIRLDK